MAWIECRFSPNQNKWIKDIRDAYLSNIAVKSEFSSLPEPHITLLYIGKHNIDMSVIKQVFNQIKEPIKVVPKCIRKGHRSPVILLDIEVTIIDKLFNDLYNSHDNEHALIDGKFVPHLTFGWMKRDRFDRLTLPGDHSYIKELNSKLLVLSEFHIYDHESKLIYNKSV
jgi:2'-5' RNA ligase